MTRPETSDMDTTATETPERKRPAWVKLALFLGVAIVAVAGVAAMMVFRTGVPIRDSLIQDTVWVLSESRITVDGDTTDLTVYPDTTGLVLCSNGAHLGADNSDGWQFINAGTWKITDDGLTVNGRAIDATWTWDTLTLEYTEGAALKHVVYTKGDDFDIRSLAAGTWQGPADMWLDWYKFEGEQIVLAEDGAFELGELTGTWKVNPGGSIDVDIDTFENTMIALFKVEDSNTLSLLDTQSHHSLALLSRLE